MVQRRSRRTRRSSRRTRRSSRRTRRSSRRTRRSSRRTRRSSRRTRRRMEGGGVHKIETKVLEFEVGGLGYTPSGWTTHYHAEPETKLHIIYPGGGERTEIVSFEELKTDLLHKINKIDNPDGDDLSLSGGITFIPHNRIMPQIIVRDDASLSELVQNNIGMKGNINFDVKYDDRVYSAE